jgi:hypothetical protein
VLLVKGSWIRKNTIKVDKFYGLLLGKIVVL